MMPPPSKARVLIAGCGYVGEALAVRLLAAGSRVYGLCRTRELPPGIEPLRADLSDPVTLAASLAPLARQPLDALVYCVSAGGYSEAAYQRAYVDGLRDLWQQLQLLGVTPRRLLFTSSTAVYGQTDGSWVDEDSPTEPSSFSGRILLQGEALAASLCPAAAVLRIGGIYGPGRDSVIRRIESGTRLRAADPQPRYRNRMHRDDIALALEHLLTLDPLQSCYLGVDDEPADLAEVEAWLCSRLGVEQQQLTYASSARTRPGNKRCRNARLREAGITLRYPSYREGYDDLLASRVASMASSTEASAGAGR